MKGSPTYVILEKKDKHEITKGDIVDFLKKNNPELVKKLESDAKSKGIDMNLKRFDANKISESDKGSISPLSLDDTISKHEETKSGSTTPNALELNKQSKEAFTRNSENSKEEGSVVGTHSPESSESDTIYDDIDVFSLFFKDNTSINKEILEQSSSYNMLCICIILFTLFLVVIVFISKRN